MIKWYIDSQGNQFRLTEDQLKRAEKEGGEYRPASPFEANIAERLEALEDSFMYYKHFSSNNYNR